MKLVFGPVPKEFADESEAFGGLNGKPYYYELEVEEEGNGHGNFRISDNCGRYMPFDFSNLDDLVRVLTRLHSYVKDKKEFDAYWNSVWNTGK